jgi:hypothetical protein
MKNKTLTQILLGSVLAIFILYFVFLHVFFLKTSHYRALLGSITDNVQTEDWSAAETSLDNFKSFWGSVQYYVQFNNAGQSYSNMNTDVINLEASIRSRQKYQTDLYVKNIESHLDNFQEIAPQP